jgi:hypothetical protein
VALSVRLRGRLWILLALAGACGGAARAAPPDSAGSSDASVDSTEHFPEPTGGESGTANAAEGGQDATASLESAADEAGVETGSSVESGDFTDAGSAAGCPPDAFGFSAHSNGLFLSGGCVPFPSNGCRTCACALSTAAVSAYSYLPCYCFDPVDAGSQLNSSPLDASPTPLEILCASA